MYLSLAMAPGNMVGSSYLKTNKIELLLFSNLYIMGESKD